MSRLKDIADQLKKHANQQRLWIELFDIIDEMGGLDTAREELKKSYDRTFQNLTELTGQLDSTKISLANQLKAVASAKAEAEEILSTARENALAVLRNAQEEISQIKHDTQGLIEATDLRLANKNADLATATAQLATAQQELAHVQQQIKDVKAEALKQLSS